MVGAAIKGVGLVSQTDSSKVSGTSKSGGEGFGKIMSKTMSIGVNSNASQNVMYKKTASSDCVKDSSVQQNTKTSVQDNKTSGTKDVSDNSQSEVSKEEVKNAEAGEKIKEFLKQKFGVSDEELEKAMADLGLCVQDLLQNANITDLVVKLTGVESAVDIITDSELSESLTDVIDYAQQLISDIQTGNELTELPKRELEIPEDGYGLSDEEVGAVHNAKDFVNTETEDDEAVNESDKTLDKVLETKITVETTEHKQSGFSFTKNENSQSQTKGDMITETAGNLSQSIQSVFAGEIQETVQLNPVEVVRQVVDAVKIIQKQSLQSIEVQLNPENLGKIHVAVSSRNGIVTAEIVTQNEQVKRAVESQMNMLKENLESQGIKVEAVEVTVQSHAFENGQNLQGNNSQQEKAEKESKHHLDLSSLDELSDDELSEDETAAKNAVMNENSSVEYTA